MGYKKVAPVEYAENGQPILCLDCDGANSSWLEALRLQKLADSGDEDAKKRLEELDAMSAWEEE